LHSLFSSRRRHTSFSRDWSSDVCSSDLGGSVLLVEGDAHAARGAARIGAQIGSLVQRCEGSGGPRLEPWDHGAEGSAIPNEEKFPVVALQRVPSVEHRAPISDQLVVGAAGQDGATEAATEGTACDGDDV